MLNDRNLYTEVIGKCYIDEDGHYCQKFIRKEVRAIPDVEKIYFNIEKGTTVVIWADGKKTIVRKSKDAEFDLYTAVSAAVAQRVFKSNSAFKRMIKQKAIMQK